MTPARERSAPGALARGTRERLARAIHDEYLRNQRGRKPGDDPALRPWELLPESLRDSNRAQADATAEKLEAIGCSFVEADDPGFEPLELTAEEIEQLAEMEHERWVGEREAAGWKPGPRDVPSKTTPHLVEWEALSDEVREYDREAVRAIPRVMKRAGLRVVRGSTE